MNKINIFIIIIICFLLTNKVISEEMDCSQFKKLSAKYIECSSKNLANKSQDLKKNSEISVENTKNQLVESNFYKKLLKLKSSKNHREFLEK